MFRKVVPESCLKLLPKVVSRSCSPKLFPNAAVQNCCPKAAILQAYTPKRLPKIILQSGPRKLLPKVATESCSPKLFVKLPRKLLPKAAVLQNNYFSKLFRKACQSYSPKRFPEVAFQSCCPMHLCKEIAPKRYVLNLFPTAAPQSYSSERLVGSKSCSPKLRSKAACTPQSCGFSKLPCRTAPQSCSCSPELLPNLLHQALSCLNKIPITLLLSGCTTPVGSAIGINRN